MKHLALLGIILFAVLSVGFAQDFVVSNSADWRDVYSTVLYSRFVNAEPRFLSAPGGVDLVISSMSRLRIGEQVLLVESSDTPVTTNFQQALENNKFVVEKLSAPSGTQMNFELAKKLDTKKFIVVDDAYGYNAISIASYAAMTKSYVLFVNKQNLNDIYDFLKTRQPEQLILYGILDRGVVSKLAEFGPEIINKGNRFDNNLEIARRFIERSPTTQAIITDGSFIEYDLVSDKFPTLFLGTQGVPESLVKFVNDSGIKIGVLIGNELTNPARALREQTGMSVFVKFAQGAATGAGMGEVRDIDRFSMPSYVLGVAIDSINYNVATKQLEVVYSNTGNVGFFIQPAVSVLSNGAISGAVGETTPIFMEKGEVLGRAYDIDLTSQVSANAALSATSRIAFGEDSGLLDQSVVLTGDVGRADVVDVSSVEIRKVTYDTSDSRLKIDVENTGASDAYVQPIVALEVGAEERSLRAETPQLVAAGKTVKVQIREIITPAEVGTIGSASITLRYGQRSNLLLKSREARLTVEVLKPDYTTLLVAIAIIILIVAAALFAKKQPLNKSAERKTRPSKKRRK